MEKRDLPYVLAVKNNEPLWVAPQGGSVPVAARRLAQSIPDDQWQRLSAGEGSKGPRLYDWGRASIGPCSEPDQGHWLLVRCSITDPEDLAYYACFGAAEVALAELVRVAGTRWIIEDAFKEAKQEVGLDEYQVRRWTRLYRHITPVSQHGAGSGAAGPCFSGGDPVLRHRRRRKKGALRVAELIPMTVPEVRRLQCRLLWQRPQNGDLTVWWSRWRRRHQARAWQSHRRRRLPRLPNHVRL